MGRPEAQGRPRQGGADFPHCRGGEIIRPDKAAQGENVNPAWTSVGRRSVKRRQIADPRKLRAIPPHQPQTQDNLGECGWCVDGDV